VSAVRPLTTTEYAVLGTVGFGEISGYDLAKAAARSIDYMWAPSRSQIYKVLPRLVEFGYTRMRDVEQRSRPDKALYAITQSGRAALRAWIEEVEEDPPGGIGIFLMKIYFGWAAPPDAALRQLDAYRAYMERHLAAFEQIEKRLPSDEPIHSRIALSHGIARASATLQWIEETRPALTKLLRTQKPAAPRRN
jgi:PadR family transcriptional regulator AphA